MLPDGLDMRTDGGHDDESGGVRAGRAKTTENLLSRTDSRQPPRAIPSCVVVW